MMRVSTVIRQTVLPVGCGIGLLCVMTGCTLSLPTPPANGTVPAPTVQALPNDDVVAAAGAYQPVAAETCAELHTAVAQMLAVPVNQEDEASFQPLFAEVEGASCRLTAEGTGEDFTNFVDVAQQLVVLLEEQGWTQDMQYVADSPTGTILGLRRTTAGGEAQLAVVQVAWSPGAAVQCPQDQPISVCAAALEPDQIHYTIRIDLARVT